MKNSAAQPANSRQRILEVSTRLFAKHGFDGVSMRNIATESDITLPAIYHHFGNKEELFKAVETEMYSSHAKSLMDQLQADLSPEERLHNFVYVMFEHLESNPDYLKLLQRNLVDGWEENQAFLVDLSLQPVMDELKVLLNEYAEGTGNGITPITIFSLILGYITLMPVIRHLKERPASANTDQAMRELLVQSVMNFVSANRPTQEPR
ncbi:TetR/AcrR family transcriptional regulator [Pseudomonas sp. TCU-HL1]|uniref:TetR/AcrR family transcriptional regulator n=1 Tax=Pseudomonas sp. TCU-HL1 TaxID=1856685 RepID=UPI00083D7255|nr:TetR/AcrR family transcriptional regulator [Pseudomonas sp. TCU-HL1]AOE86805.1 TetR family transcriptional regulator [Pseudomonas sp. TCU-HL1]